MRLINHNRETLVLQTRLFQNQVLSVRERLQRHHNNRRTGQHRLRQLTTLAPTRIRNSGNHTPLIIKLQNRVLQLLVKNAAVGHEDDGIKVRLTNLVTDANELMRQPRNSLRLPTTSTVRNQVRPARAFLPHGRNHLRHRIPLVIPRENQRLTRIRLPLRRFLMLNLNKHELLENPQPVIPLQHVFPEVTDRVSVRVGSVTRATAIALVERQEECILSRQVRRHENLAVTHREMHHGTPLLRQQRLRTPLGILRLPVTLVLPNRSLNTLCKVGLQLDSSDGQAVDEEHQVNRARIVNAVLHLRHHPQDVRLVMPNGSLVTLVLRAWRSHPQRTRTSNLKAMPQHTHHTMLSLIERPREPIQHPLLNPTTVRTLQTLPLFSMSRPQPGGNVIGVDRALAVITSRVTNHPAVPGQVRDDVLLKTSLTMSSRETRRHSHHLRHDS